MWKEGVAHSLGGRVNGKKIPKERGEEKRKGMGKTHLEWEEECHELRSGDG